MKLMLTDPVELDYPRSHYDNTLDHRFHRTVARPQQHRDLDDATGDQGAGRSAHPQHLLHRSQSAYEIDGHGEPDHRQHHNHRHDSEPADLDGSAHAPRVSHSEIERRRRNKLNAYIQDLSTLVPLCRNVHSRKLDKLTILKMSVQYLKNMNRSSSKQLGKSSRKNLPTANTPRVGSDLCTTEELLQLCLTASEGFLLVVDCFTGLVLHASEASSSVLQSMNHLTGRNFLDLIHPTDIPTVRYQLTQMERPFEVSHGGDSTQQQQRQSQLLSERAFVCRMLRQSQPHGRSYQTEQPSVYLNLTVNGYIKALRTQLIRNVDQEYGARHPPNHIFVALAQVDPTRSTPAPTFYETNSRFPTEFTCRFTPEAQYTAVDPETSTVLGYTLQDLSGSSVYRICHHEDMGAVAESHRTLMNRSGPVTTQPYRLLARNGQYVTVVTYWQAFRNPLTNAVEAILARSRVLPQATSMAPLCLSVRAVSEQDDRSQHSSIGSTSSANTATPSDSVTGSSTSRSGEQHSPEPYHPSAVYRQDSGNGNSNRHFRGH